MYEAFFNAFIRSQIQFLNYMEKSHWRTLTHGKNFRRQNSPAFQKEVERVREV